MALEEVSKYIVQNIPTITQVLITQEEECHRWPKEVEERYNFTANLASLSLNNSGHLSFEDWVK
jgi:hypothetical protein